MFLLAVFIALVTPYWSEVALMLEAAFVMFEVTQTSSAFAFAWRAPDVSMSQAELSVELRLFAAMSKVVAS